MRGDLVLECVVFEITLSGCCHCSLLESVHTDEHYKTVAREG